MGTTKKKRKFIKRGTKKKTSRKELPEYGKLHAFRSDRELTALLEDLDNKTNFITTALKEAFAKKVIVTCPTCKGDGVIRRGK